MNDNSKFLAYIHQPMSWPDIQMIYKKNNISIQKCELFNDFIKSLLLTILETYMGDEITNTLEQNNHFNWCWGKTVKGFSEEGFNLNDPKIRNYFFEFSREIFYTNKNKDKDQFESGVLKIWDDLFNYSAIKTNSDIDVLVEIYNIMDKSLKK